LLLPQQRNLLAGGRSGRTRPGGACLGARLAVPLALGIHFPSRDEQPAGRDHEQHTGVTRIPDSHDGFPRNCGSLPAAIHG